MDEVFAKFPISDLCPHNSLAGIGTECENQCGWGLATAAPGVCHVSSSVNSARASCQAAVVSACRSRGNACGLRRCKSSSRLRVLVTAQKQVMFFWAEGGVGFVWRWGAQGRAFSGEVFCSSVGAGVYTRGARIALRMHFLPRLPRRGSSAVADGFLCWGSSVNREIGLPHHSVWSCHPRRILDQFESVINVFGQHVLRSPPSSVRARRAHARRCWSWCGHS